MYYIAIILYYVYYNYHNVCKIPKSIILVVKLRFQFSNHITKHMNLQFTTFTTTSLLRHFITFNA